MKPFILLVISIFLYVTTTSVVSQKIFRSNAKENRITTIIVCNGKCRNLGQPSHHIKLIGGRFEELTTGEPAYITPMGEILVHGAHESFSPADNYDAKRYTIIREIHPYGIVIRFVP